jgi:hypothetical protein
MGIRFETFQRLTGDWYFLFAYLIGCTPGPMLLQPHCNRDLKVEIKNFDKSTQEVSQLESITGLAKPLPI